MIRSFATELSVGGLDAGALEAQGSALDALAGQRNHAQAEYDSANNAERLGFLNLQTLVLGLPKTVESELDDHTDTESALLDLLSGVYAIKPRNPESVVARGMKLASVLPRVNAYLAAQEPARPEVKFGGLGLAELNTALTAQVALERGLLDRQTVLDRARAALRDGAVALDRVNKRVYARLKSEARVDPALANELGRIDTGAPNLPATLSIKSVLQGGAENLQLLVGYDPNKVDAKAESTLEWQVEGVDGDFANSAAIDPSGNTLGPFAVGQTVKLRTRVRNSQGSTTSSTRTLKIS
ncbi:MAG: hypothetical protein AB3X44_06885 [Leptothrix sp. (in: b-proteobacteria)]